jgi:hypothetical protein
MKRCHGRLHYNREFQIFIFLIGHINVNKGVFCLIISYLQIKSYNVLNYNNCSTDWRFPLIEKSAYIVYCSTLPGPFRVVSARTRDDNTSNFLSLYFLSDVILFCK